MSALHTAGFRALGRALILTLVLSAAGIGAVCAQGNRPFREILAAANGGDAGAQYMAGMTYLLGQGTRQDIPAAVRWLQQSAQAGLPQALVALAGLHDVGQGVPFDANRATQLRQQAARAGNSTARSQLEVDARIPGTRDYRRASILTDMKLYAQAIPPARKAAAAGSPEGQELLARALLLGQGVAVDKAAALELYEQAAAAGNVDAMRGLAYMYEFGEGVRVDRKKALVYYDQAAAKGSKIARQAAANLRSPDYDARPRSDGGGEGSSAPDFYYVERMRCDGAGGRWMGTQCVIEHTGIVIQP
jgi:TPR repeat protein